MWRAWIQKPIEASKQLQAWVQEAAQSGTATARSVLGGLPFCASLTSTSQEQDADVKEDLIHYFLIPCGIDESRYMLFSKRQLPLGVGTENDLPQFSVFHLPNTGADQKLEALILEQLSEQAQAQRLDTDETIEDRLDRVAGLIEKHSNRITMGIIIIGGVVAVANPLLGVGIAAKALFPSLGGLATTEAMKMGGGKIRQWREKSSEKRAAKEAMTMLKARKTRVLINPFLARLQYAIDTPEECFDPSMMDPFLKEATDFSDSLRAVTLEVLVEYYQQIEPLEGDSQLGPEDRRWLKMLYQYAKADPSI